MRSKNKLNYKKIHELSEEFTHFIFKMQGVYLDSLIGYKLINTHIGKSQSLLKRFMKDEPATDKLQDQLLFQHKDIYGNDFAASSIHFSKIKEVKKRNKHEGENSKFIGSMCIVIMFSYWEHYYRGKIAKAYGSPDAKNIQDDFWGDMRRLRNDIVHNKSKCKESENTKLLCWFKKNEDIVITQNKMRNVFLEALKYRNKLYKDSLSKIDKKIPFSEVPGTEH